jgi:hypothetical protein
VLLLLPGSPDEVYICREAFLGAILPPVALLEDAFDDRTVVAYAHIELLRLVHSVRTLVFLAILRCVFGIGAHLTLKSASLSIHVGLNNSCRDVIARQDRLMEHVVHFDLHRQNELSAEEVLSEGCL